MASLCEWINARAKRLNCLPQQHAQLRRLLLSFPKRKLRRQVCTNCVIHETYVSQRLTDHHNVVNLRTWILISMLGDRLCSHISATIEQIITKFSTVVTHLKWTQICQFQLICIMVTMVTKYNIPPMPCIRGNAVHQQLLYVLFYLTLYIMLATCYFVPWIYLVPDNLTLNISTWQR